MNANRRFRATFVLCGLTLLLLLWLTAQRPLLPVPLSQTIILGGLIVFTLLFGIPLGGGFASLLPMVQFMIYLGLGLMPAAWLSFAGGWLHGLFRYWFGPKLQIKRPSGGKLDFISVTAFNAVIQTLGILAAGLIFEQLGGDVPLLSFDLVTHGPPFLAAMAAYFLTNHLIFTGFLRLGYPERLPAYWQQLPRSLLYELAPILFAPLMAVVYTRLGKGYFLLLVGMQVSASLITYRLELTRQRLERRVRELGSLQAVGHALSLSLDLDEVLTAVYDQVSALMPASIFYVALYDADTNTIAFPFVVKDGEIIPWQSRSFTWGRLTEYVLDQNRPVLIEDNWQKTVQKLGLDPAVVGRNACWLGVPIRAGDHTLGVMSVQSQTEPAVYTQSHQDLLLTVATQAGVAIQNARLYAQIDNQLARRVQELNSIFSTTQDGILLLSADGSFVSANRAFFNLFDLAEAEDACSGRNLADPALAHLAQRIDYTPAELQSDDTDWQQIAPHSYKQRRVLSYGERFLERTLTPVYDRKEKIDGWLLVFREVTEEIQLDNLREEMTHMLVHDLRSPLALILGGVELSLAQIEKDSLLTEPLHIVQRNGVRMLQLINNLLDVYKLENGNVLLRTEMMPIQHLFDRACVEFHGLAQEADIDLAVVVADDLPPVSLDSDYMARVLHNLLDNAFKFTPAGGTICLWARPGRTGHVLLGVRDTGQGVPPAIQGCLFDKFEQWWQMDGRRRGTGLGLTYCRLAVQAHGGKIWVESSGRAGEGSEFIISLPLLSVE
ncbi:MAG: ATP-binding protein [Chloroflexota bacterium]